MITLEKNGIRAGTIVAGGSEYVTVSDEAALDLPAGARVICTLTAALPPDAVHLLAASEEMSFDAWNTHLSLYTVPLREYFQERRIIESLPARLEFFDLAHQTVLGACTVQVQNSRLLWGDAEAGVPAAQIGLTRADMAQLEREMAEAKATVGEALAAGEETKKYAMVAASNAESARQSAAGSKRVAAAAQEAAAAAQGTATAAQGAVNTHAARTDNPHAVTAEQVGAVTKTDLNEYARLKHDNGFTGKNSFGGGALVINTDGYVDAATRMQLSVVNGTGPTLVLSDHGVFFKSSTDSKAITPSAFYLGWQGRDFVAARDFCITNDAIDLTNPRYASEEFDAATGVFPCYNSFSWGDHPYRVYYVYLDESSTVPGIDLETSNLWPIMRDNQAVDISVYVNNQSTLDVVTQLYDESFQPLTGHNVLYGTTYLLEFTVIKCSYAPRLLIKVR